VEKLILYGGYMRGAFHRGSEEARSTFRAMIDLARAAWGSENATFRQVFTSRFIPGGSREQLDWFNDLCLKSTTGEVAAKLLEARGKTFLTESLSGLRVPTLVLHSRYDEVVPIAEGRMMASQIPGAQFVELDSRNHVVLEHEAAWERFCDAVLEFMKPGGAGRSDDAFGALSLRERQVLALIADGFSNQQIAEQLEISEKTVRNHASNVFDKLGVWSRAQAIVLAKDRGFSG